MAVVCGKEGGEKKLVSLEDLSKNKLVKLITRLSAIRKKKYKRRKQAKYGSLNRGFTDAELKRFMGVIRNEKAWMCFNLMANLGLRVGEVVILKWEDIDFQNKRVRVHTEKAQTIDFLPMTERVQKLLRLWVQKSPPEANREDYLFRGQRLEHASPNWLRREFRDACKLADLNETYGDSEETMIERKRSLYRLTTHSLRHYFITRVYNKTKNPIHSQRLARHKDFGSTQVYIHCTDADLTESMAEAFREEGANLNKEDTEDLVDFFKMWKAMRDKK
ncbi:tyrosine-type recombinase/integrase [Candidatus Woesearchaeota archaeon]|nr:tyrosine-type recombinase/integrase [Candidatus Woesearchaeota archaeon]